jgi:hypothetical protein
MGKHPKGLFLDIQLYDKWAFAGHDVPVAEMIKDCEFQSEFFPDTDLSKMKFKTRNTFFRTIPNNSEEYDFEFLVKEEKEPGRGAYPVTIVEVDENA